MTSVRTNMNFNRNDIVHDYNDNLRLVTEKEQNLFYERDLQIHFA